jgi:hypothetical protein
MDVWSYFEFDCAKPALVINRRAITKIQKLLFLEIIRNTPSAEAHGPIVHAGLSPLSTAIDRSCSPFVATRGAMPVTFPFSSIL